MTDRKRTPTWTGPVMTLVAAGVVGAGLLIADAVTDPGGAAQLAAAPVTASASGPPAAPSPTSTASSSPSASPTSTAPSATRTPVFPDEAVYVGLSPTRLSVAVAIRHGVAAAYVCDGRSVESWLTGSVTEGGAGDTAQLASGRDSLTVRHTDSGVQVTGRIHGVDLTLTAAPGEAPAGLYRLTSGDGTTIGWIVQPDGTQVGLQNRAGVVAPAPPLVPGQGLTVGGQASTPKEVHGDDRF